MVLLYWDIGRMILARQESTGWGAKVIDRLSTDLHEAFPDMKGFSPRNLKYMRAFAAAWPKRTIVQEPLARIPWYHHLALMEIYRVGIKEIAERRRNRVLAYDRYIAVLNEGAEPV
jgi:predicted nuclease of restriction endonuclease-like (RecB) superfamily